MTLFVALDIEIEKFGIIGRCLWSVRQKDKKIDAFSRQTPENGLAKLFTQS